MAFLPEQQSAYEAQERRKKYFMDLLSGATAPEQTQFVSGRAVPYSPIQGLSKVAKALMARKGIEAAESEQERIGQEYKSGRQGAMQRVTDLLTGRPEQPYRLSPEEQFGDEQIPGLKTAAVEADPMQALIQGTTDPYLQGSGISNVAAALISKNKDTRQPFTLSEGQKRYDAEGNLIAEGAEKKEKDKDLWETLSPEETEKKYGKGYVVQRNAAGKEQVLVKPHKTESRLGTKEKEIARSKILAAKTLLEQLKNVKNRFYGVKDEEGNITEKGIKDTSAAGFMNIGSSPITTEAGNRYDAAVDNMRATLTGMQKVPGIGAMSDYETRLDQSKMPTRGMFKYESSIEDQIKYIEDYARGILTGYETLLNPDVDMFGGDNAETGKTDKKVKSRRKVGDRVIVQYEDGTFGEE